MFKTLTTQKIIFIFLYDESFSYIRQQKQQWIQKWKPTKKIIMMTKTTTTLTKYNQDLLWAKILPTYDARTFSHSIRVWVLFRLQVMKVINGNTECKPCLQPKLTYHGILIRTWFYSILFVCLFEIDILLVFVYVCMFGCA